MKVILYMAISLNGIIAYKDGSEDFLPHDGWDQLVKVSNEAGGLIWGRKTYDLVSKLDDSYLDPLKNVKKIIISKSDIKLKDTFELAKNPEEALEKLIKFGCKDIILTGGSTTNSSFAKSNLIDEVLLYLNPIIIGEGIPLFNSDNFKLKLKLIGYKKIGKDIIEVRYKVKK